MSRSSGTWISQGFENLLHKLDTPESPEPYDVVIIGSGYGGAMAASQLAGLEHNGTPLKVCVLERGNEYLPGMFPSRLADLPRHVRFSTPNSAQPSGNRDALFDLRLSPTLTTVVANGLGGGSLINAGVMIEPKPDRFQQGWPKAFASADALTEYYQQAKELLGAVDREGHNTIARHTNHSQQPLHKHRQLQLLASDAGEPEVRSRHFHNAAITVAMHAKTNSGGVKLDACNLCGDCATGCNHNAKDSLDTNLLVKAHQRGVELYTGATVLKVEANGPKPDEDGWALSVVHTTSKLRKQQLKPLQLKTRKLILAAGSLGSSEILLRSQSEQLAFSSQLGQRFSSNGDMLASVFNQRHSVNAVANENQQPDQRLIGPTITGVIDLRDQHGVLIEEMAVPGALRRLYEELVTTSDCLANLVNIDRSEHLDGQPDTDPYAVNAEQIERTAIYAIMGDDGSQGALELIHGDSQEPDNLDGDGAVFVRWSGLPHHPLFEHQIEVLETLVSQSGVGGRAQGNPAWRALPASMDKLLGGGRGPLLTVHPLGGCSMAEDHHSGVVDQYGRVFNPADRSSDRAVYNSLAVLDGAMIPRALGANPALTIAAVSLRAIHYLRQQWGFTPPNEPNAEQPWQQPVVAPYLQRPRFADKSRVGASKPTAVEITERISGRVTLTDHRQQPLDCVVDITLRCQPKPVLDLVHATDRTLTVNPAPADSELTAHEPVSQLRIFKRDEWQTLIQQGASDARFSECALLVAPVDGTLEIMGRENSTYSERLWRAIGAWLPNRGLRDSWQALEDWQHARRRHQLKGPRPSAPWLSRTWRAAAAKIHEIKALASHAGEMRLFDYQLRVHRPASGWSPYLGGFDPNCASLEIKGLKRISYTRAANPMRQFEDMHLSVFPGLQPNGVQAGGKAAYLRFDSRFLTHYNKPLLRIVEQQDQATALADMAAFFMYFARVLIGVHLWSFRKPDRPLPVIVDRLPGAISQVAPPEIIELPVATHDVGLAVDLPVNVRLTRYPQRHSQQPPVVMIHGYSASGNTFTHPALNTSLAKDFWQRGRDVWVLDLRTSSGMPTAMLPWSFEDVAFADIPVAIDHICAQTGQPQVDIIAHCMGSAMFSMAVLAPPPSGAAFFRERQLLPSRIHKAILSQVGPRVVFSPENIFRAYTLSYAQQLMPYVFYAFKRSDAPGALEQLLDRLLSALPYPEGEFEQENPLWPWKKTAYVGTRHRMDGLYGRTFSLANLSQTTLDHIDDLFGPLNMETLSQVIQFALHERVTNRQGENEFVTRERLKQFWRFPTLSVHGDQNGLADLGTLGRMRQTMSAAGCDYQTEVLTGFGHQDALIGKNAKVNFDKMYRFLMGPKLNHPPRQKLQPYNFRLPVSGPVIGSWHKASPGEPLDSLPVSLGIDAQMGNPEFVIYLAVNQLRQPPRNTNHRWQLAAADDDRFQKGLCVQLAQPQEDRWLQQRLPLNDSFKQADGILVLLVDDSELKLEQLRYASELPDNLLWLTHTAEGVPHDEGAGPQQLADYLRQHLLSPNFRASLERFLDQPATILTPAVIQLPQPPATGSSQLQFALGACQYTPGMLDRRPAYRSYGRLAERLNRARQQAAAAPPAFMVLTGDQVYTDASAGLLDPTDRHSRFTRSYHNWLRQPEVRSVLRRLPVFMMLDDHELQNDWDLSEQHLGDAHLFRDGKCAYLNFQRNRHQALSCCAEEGNGLWYGFRQQGFDFFMLDSRTERHGRRVGAAAPESQIYPPDDAELISPAQMASLQQWLLARPLDDRPRFIVSPSMLLPRRRRSQDVLGSLHSDAWDGYPNSLHELLAFIARHQLRNLVFLSGDEHLSSVVDITLSHNGRDLQLLSIHSSGLYAPFSFVNSTPDLFAAREHFAVSPGIDCSVQSHFYPGDGFALISVSRQQGQWVLECEFDREPDAELANPVVRRVLAQETEPQPS